MAKTTKAVETITYPKTLLLGIWAPYNKTDHIESYYDEFLKLAHTCGVVDPVIEYVRVRTIDPGYFLTEGKRIEIQKLCEENNIEHVVISEPLSPHQHRNLRKLFKAKVFDRTDLILEIFENAAVSGEGKLQVEIAKLQHQKTQLAGRGIHLSQQRGGIGLRSGFGETQKEKETRHIEERIKILKKELASLSKTRETQRKQRISGNLPLICLVGYTNAGKSTILNTLTKSNVLAEDKLFATLDTTTRELYIENKKTALISDTVGFIQMLPPQLIEAFKSTLSELNYANLLLHVVDVSDPDFQLHINVVENILKDLKIDKPLLYVFNKVDNINPKEMSLQMALDQYRPQVLISAISKEGIEPLINFLQHACKSLKKSAQEREK